MLINDFVSHTLLNLSFTNLGSTKQNRFEHAHFQVMKLAQIISGWVKFIMSYRCRGRARGGGPGGLGPPPFEN